MTAAERDNRLEQALDSYIQQSLQDDEAARQFLHNLATTDSDNAILASRVRLLSYLATDALYQKQPQRADELLQQLLQLATTTEDPDTLTEIYATELELLFYQQHLDQAIIKVDQIEQPLAQTISPRVRYYAHNVLGRLFKADGQYEQALQHLISALDAVTETDDALTLRRRSFLNYSIAQVHTELKNWPQARQLTTQLVADAIKYKHNDFLPDLYLLLGFIAGSDKQYQDAIHINQQGLISAQQNNREDLALTFENNLGASYIKLEQYPQAKKVLLQAKERAVKLDDEYSQQLIDMNLGYIQVMAGEHAAGLERMQASMRYFSENATKADYEPYYEELANAYAAAGLYQQQAQTLLEQMALREYIRSADRESRLNELQNRYDSKAKAQQITILEQENSLKAQLLENKQLQQKLTLLFVVVMLFAAVLLFQLYRKVRHSNRKLNETNKQLAFQSQRDPLTGLYNRRALQQHMQVSEQKRRETDGPRSLTGLLLLDIDFFKRINDHYGHAAGDAVLIDISKRLQETCREQDLVVRWGGEEILLLLDNIDPTKVAGFIQRILEAIVIKPVVNEQQTIAVTASGGFIHLPFSGVSEQQLDWEKVMQIVDMALYMSKANGRNQVCMINGLQVSFEQAESLLYSDLTGAVRAGMLDVTVISGPGGSVS